jgi:CHAT domain-containing protein
MVDLENPLLSSISIGEDFRVLDMSQIQSKANLLVFAACLSGLGRATIGSDVLGFTHVVLGTGCQAYIGTLFEVSDFASMVLMTLFYRNIKNDPSLSLVEALRRAQVEFLQFDTDKATRFIDNLLDTWNMKSTTAPDGVRNPADIVPEGEYLLTLQKMLLPQLDWTSPYFWAPFVLMGYGDFCFCPDAEPAFLEGLATSPKLIPQDKGDYLE